MAGRRDRTGLHGHPRKAGGRGEHREPGEPPLLPRPRRVDLVAEPTVPFVGRPCLRTDSSLAPEAYRISIDADRVTIEAGGEAGFFYGRSTLEQLQRVYGAREDSSGDREAGRTSVLLPVGRVDDSPDLPVRAVMLDVSRTKVPKIETLFSLIDRLASWKVNQLQLYMEHTFAYANHFEVWANADPYDADDMSKLFSYCSERHIELVPNQNTLGHMERWLMHQRYAAMGVRRGVVMSPFGLPMPASTLDPRNPASLSFVRGLLAELGEAVPGSLFHVGLDEPWELPAERSGEWGAWAASLRQARELEGRQMLVWGDFLAAHSDLLASLADGVTVCEWGYEANHPFAARGVALAEAGVEHWMCPGTSSWMSILGRATNSVENCRSAATSALDTGATGLMVTDWGDFGHHQYLPVAETGIAAAAAFAWCADSNGDLDARSVCDLVSTYSFEDSSSALGTALAILGDLYTILPLQIPNMSALFAHVYLPQLPVGSGLTSGLTLSHLEEVDAKLDESLAHLARAEPSSANGRLAVSELTNSALLARVATADARARLTAGGQGLLGQVEAPRRARLADELGQVIAQHRSLWTARNREGGLDESSAWLEHLLRCYRTGEADPQWAGPLVELIRSRSSKQ